MNIPFIKKQIGFTLVELLVVMLILTALASVTLDFTKDFAFQGRYEVTKDRYEKIKRAIIGRPDVLINGQPDISRFVADIGRPPFALQELLSEGFCSDTQYFDQASCIGATPAKIWTGNSYGWNGPYIRISKTPDDPKAISDGWGNTALGNYGWTVKYYSDTGGGTLTTTTADILSMSVQSLGKDSTAGGTGYDTDYPSSPLISDSDWSVDINNISVTIITDTVGSCSNSTCSNPGFTSEFSCTKDNRAWVTSPTNACTYPNLTDQTLCEGNGYTWDIGESRCENSIYTASDCDATIRSWENHDSKNNCSLSGETWTTPSANVCLGFKQAPSDTAFIANSSNATIILDGNTHTITFSGMATPQPTGKLFLGVYADCDPNRQFLSVCEDSKPQANFQLNCGTNGGLFISGTPNYCYNFSDDLDCTGTTEPQLEGAIVKQKSEIQFSLSPNMTFPIINW